MAAMNHDGLRELRDHATPYLSGGDPIAVTRQDRAIGVSVPFKRDEEKVRQA
jgi:hypothetical protein